MYEITYLEKPGGEPYQFDQLIAGLSGKLASSKTLGEKPLAYPIKKQGKAFFTTAVFELPKENVAKLKDQLSAEENVLRFLLLSQPIEAKPIATTKEKERKKTAAEMEAVVSKIVESKELEEAAPTIVEKPKPAVRPKLIKKAVAKPVQPVPEKLKEEKEMAKLREEKTLDETLDELLKE